MRQQRITARVFLENPLVAGLTKPDANDSARGEVVVGPARGMVRPESSVVINTRRPRVMRPVTGSWSARIWAALRAA